MIVTNGSYSELPVKIITNSFFKPDGDTAIGKNDLCSNIVKFWNK